MNTITDLINMADVRDSQRSKVYLAESRWMFAYPGTRLETVTDMEEFTADVWRICCLPGNVPAIRPGHAARRAFYRPYQHYIAVPRMHRSTPTLLHEIAHAIPAWQKHTPSFAGRMLALTHRIMGWAASRDLAMTYAEAKVRVEDGIVY